MSEEYGEQTSVDEFASKTDDESGGADGGSGGDSAPGDAHDDGVAGTAAQFSVDDPETLATAVEQASSVHQYVTGENEQTTPGTLPGLAGRLMEQAGDIPGKYDPPVALSTHVINVVVTGLSAYVYDRVVKGPGETAIDEEEVRLLTAALALHDANKYVDGAYDVDIDTDQNTETVLDWYFEHGDDLGIERVLPGDTEDELALDRADVKWLVQRTETKDATAGTRGEASRRVRGLERYCRIADGFVSTVHAEGLQSGVDWLRSLFDDDDDRQDVHYLSFSALEQSVLNEHLVGAVKDVIRGQAATDAVDAPPTHGVVLGSTPESVAYLGEPIDRADLRDHVAAALMERITEEHDFNAKTEWRAFEYDILAEVDIPFERKREIIADGFAETLKRGSGTDHEFERVPDGFRDGLPELAKVVFRDQTYETAFADYPAMARLWEQVYEGEEYNAFTRKIGYLAELLRRYMGSVGDGFDTDQLREELAAFSDAEREGLREELAPDSSAGEQVVDRFFSGGLGSDPTVPAADEMCFLCGRPAETAFKKGNDAFYGTQSFSRRVPPEGNYKAICPVCNLEHAVLRDVVEDHDYNADEDIKIAFVYYDEFLADLAIQGADDPSGLIRALQGDADDEEVRADLADPELMAGSFGRQYHLQPLYVDSENARLRQVRELLVDLVQRGLKVVIGKPFAGFRPQPALFADLDPTRRQTAYGADRIGSFADLRRVVRLFDILRGVADSSDYQGGREMTQLQRDGFLPVASLVAENTEYGYDARSLADRHFRDSYDHQYMLMQDVAREGFEMYGFEFDSRHKKTKIFRRAVDATLDGLNRGMDDDQLREHVTGQVYKAATADAERDHYVQPDHADSFVAALFDLLEEHGDLNKSDLSQRRNTLSNTYLFAYDRVMQEQSSDDEESSDAGGGEEEDAPADD